MIPTIAEDFAIVRGAMCHGCATISANEALARIEQQMSHRASRCLDKIAETMRRKEPDDFLLSEIQDYLSMAGYSVPLRSYRAEIDSIECPECKGSCPKFWGEGWYYCAVCDTPRKLETK